MLGFGLKRPGSDPISLRKPLIFPNLLTYALAY